MEWTCKNCNNVNNGETCLKCKKPKPPKFTEDQINAFKCQNEAAKDNNIYHPVDLESAEDSSITYFTIFYNLARKPLLEEIKKLKKSNKNPKANKTSKQPKVGDKVWTSPMYDKDPINAELCKVVKVCSSGFYVDKFSLMRMFDGLGKTWWWEDPDGSKTQ